MRFNLTSTWGTCALCAGTGHQYRDLCQPCFDDLPLNTDVCHRCALPLSTGLTEDPSNKTALCGRCQQTLPMFDRIIAPYRYEAPCDFMLTQLKFAKKLYFARLIGALLAAHVSTHTRWMPDAIIPVPLHPNRLRQRGFNQSAQIAKATAKQLPGITGKLNSTTVRRTRNTQAQMELPARQRHKNIRGAFCIDNPTDAKCIALIDDVITTTATVNEVARVLKQAGAQEVHVWAFARAG